MLALAFPFRLNDRTLHLAKQDFLFLTSCSFVTFLRDWVLFKQS